MNKILLLGVTILGLTSCNSPESTTNVNNTTTGGPLATPPLIGFSIKNTFPHDTTYFTEGYEYVEGQLIESSGGDQMESPYPSAWGYADLKTGKNISKGILDNAIYFGEGITVFNKKLYQLTWKNQVAFQYDFKTGKKLKEFTIPTKEGWGLTHDTASLIMSDGSSNIYYLEPETFRIKNILRVYDAAGPVANINELEYVNGVIYANQWLTPYIFRIDAKSGEITGKLDLSSIDNEISGQYPNTFGLNGIAYNQQNGTLLITGKKWPKSYELQLQ